ncbi:MAG: glycosyltransferase [Terracidiphilus sp.]
MTNHSTEGQRIAYIGCWYNRDMYSHNCSNLVESLRRCGANIDVVTSNCRCFSSATKFDISVDELINQHCAGVAIPHAPANPGRKHGRMKFLAVRMLRIDLWLAIARGFLYYRKSSFARTVHYDQVLEAFGVVPLYVLAMLASLSHKRLFVTVHEVDPFQRRHAWVNKLYDRCERVIVYSEDMKRGLIGLGVKPERITVTKYSAEFYDIAQSPRTKYIYFGGHNILRGKGYTELLDALKSLQAKGVNIQLVLYVGHGCNGLEEAREMARRAGVDGMIEWSEFFTGPDLAKAYQACKACIIPYTHGSARHALTTAMTNGTPVIATRHIDIPEYLGNHGIYIDGSADSIADAICNIENKTIDTEALGIELRKLAAEDLDVGKVAVRLCDIYAGQAS